MSYVPVITSSAATAAAAAKAARERQEEENLTKYNGDELDGWEFKIVRNFTGRFKDSKFVQQLCREEATSGWEMLEKFDDYRIRFKRRTDRRSGDQYAKIDPYRTQIGMGSGSLVALIVGISFAVIGLILLLVFLLKG